MPKIKTHSGAKRNLRKMAVTDKTNVAQVKRLLPYK